MARPCESCRHPRHDEIDRKLRAGVSFIDVERWVRDATPDRTLTAQSIGKHAKAHVGVASVQGRRPASGDFLESVRDAAAEGLASGELAVTLKDGIAAQRALDARVAKDADRDLHLKLAMLLSGHLPAGRVRVLSPEVEAIEAEFRPLLTPGAE